MLALLPNAMQSHAIDRGLAGTAVLEYEGPLCESKAAEFDLKVGNAPGALQNYTPAVYARFLAYIHGQVG